MWQLYKIVGSLELVGNPIGLLSSLGSGVRDFFYEPAHAIITSPTEIRKIGRGVVKGAVSLVSNTTVGFLGTGITITRSIGRGVAKLSMDSTYLRRREELQRVPSTIKEAAKRPLKDVGNGFYYAVVGVVKVPYKSVRQRGIIGLIPGIAKVAMTHHYIYFHCYLFCVYFAFH
jgi:vacuolar protein sorting-associated protein 13A/C